LTILSAKKDIPKGPAEENWFFNYVLKGVTMNTLNKDILIGLLFIIGIWSFVSGQFIFSTILFAGAAIYSNVVIRSSETR
jgi:hypothetical protein